MAKKASKSKILDKNTQAIVNRLTAARATILSGAPWRKDVIERIDRSIELNTRIGACTAEEALQQIEAVAGSYRLAVAGQNLDREIAAEGNSNEE